MFWFGLILGGVVGGGIGWGLTYLWFKRDKVRFKIAAEVNLVASKASSAVVGAIK